MDTATASRRARMHHEPRRITKREMIRQFILASADGATCDEIEAALGINHQTCSARISEMAKANLIRNSEKTRNTRSGTPAVVWERPEPFQTTLF